MDQHFNVGYEFQKWTLGIGYSILNDNTVIHYKDQYKSIDQDIEFDTFTLNVSRKIKEWFSVEGKILYANQGFPNDPNREVMIYSIRIFREFRMKTICGLLMCHVPFG